MSFVLLGILNSAAAGGEGSPFFIARSNANDFYFGSGYYDQTWYVSGSASDNSLVEQANDGVHSNPIVLTSPNGTFSPVAVSVDANGQFLAGFFTGFNTLVTSITNNTINWVLNLSAGTFRSTVNNSNIAKLNDNGELSIVGATYDTNNSDDRWAFIIRLNPTNGGIVEQKLFFDEFNGSRTPRVNFTAVDTRNNYTYAIGRERTADSYISYARMAPNGSIDVQKSEFRVKLIASCIKSHDDNSLYMGFNYNSDPRRAVIHKTNSLGSTRIWEKYYQNPDGDRLEANFIDTDSAGNVYFACDKSNDVGNDSAAILKFNSSGTLLWQREFINSAYNEEPKGLIVTDEGISLTTFSLNIKIPLDGTLTGTYDVGGNTVTYQASSLFENNEAGISWGSGTLIQDSQSMVTGTETLNLASGTIDQTITELE